MISKRDMGSFLLGALVGGIGFKATTHAVYIAIIIGLVIGLLLK